MYKYINKQINIYIYTVYIFIHDMYVTPGSWLRPSKTLLGVLCQVP